MRTVVIPFTRLDYAKLPEGFPAELVRGHLVREPAPTYGHQRLQADVFSLLLPLVPRGCALVAPVDVTIDDWNVFQPDLVVLRTRPSAESRDVGLPLIAVEVLSPGTERRDRTVKRARLLAAGVSEVWIVDPATKTVELHDAAGCRSAKGAETLRSAAVPGFEVVPATLFELPPP